MLVLLVEDTKGRIDDFIANNPGIQFHWTDRVEQAIALLQCNHYDAISFDFNLPGTDSRPVARWLLHNTTAQLSPLILIHTNDREGGCILHQILVHLPWRFPIHRIEGAWEVPHLLNSLLSRSS